MHSHRTLRTFNLLLASAGVTLIGATAHAQQTAASSAKSAQTADSTRHRVMPRSKKKTAETQATLQQEAKITMDSAKAIAARTVPGGAIQSSELEREHGKLIYSFDIKVTGKSGIEEVNVDALTGALVAHEHESPKAESAEKKQEAREARAPSAKKAPTR